MHSLPPFRHFQVSAVICAICGFSVFEFYGVQTLVRLFAALALGLSFTAARGAPEFLRGGDISELPKIEDAGGRFSDKGETGDALRILHSHGANFVRIRLYNDPGNPAYSPSRRLVPGYQDLEASLALARRAKALGFQIQLTLHYSDYWTNGERQTKPHAWDGLAFPALEQAVFDYTREVLRRLTAQGTPPEFVSLGNEIQAGILYPDGAVVNWPDLAALLRAGWRGVKAGAPAAKVVLHLDGGGDLAKYDYFFGRCEKHEIPYDVIGASYYPFWTRKSVAEVTAWAAQVHAKFRRPVLIMEAGYNWHPTLPDGRRGQLADNGGAPYPSSPDGQRDFLRELSRGLQSLPAGTVLGFLYWDPVMIAVPGVGWEKGGRNVVSNTTLFDFEGRALPALEVFRDGHAKLAWRKGPRGR